MLFQNHRHRKHIKKWGSKNKGYFQVFDEKIVVWQDKLIWLLNHPILKYWFRWVLRIHKDCEWNETIDKLLPNSYRIPLGNGKYKQDFRTHNKFSKRLYYAFRPLWWTLHAIDWIIQKTFYPELSFGFDELTAYPSASNTTGWDGFAGYDGNSESYTTVRNAVNAVSYAAATYTPQTANVINGGNYYVYRGYLMFLCTVIGETGIISDATLSFHASNKEEADTGQGKLHIVGSTIGSISYIQASDYSKIGSTSFSNIANASISTSVYNDLILDSNGISNIDKTTSWSKFGFRIDGDLNNNTPVLGGNRVYWKTADTAGTSQDPKLVVTYTLPASGQQQMMV